MVTQRLDTMIQLESELTVLRAHFILCGELAASDVVDWAKLFKEWSRRISKEGEGWTVQNLLQAEKLVSHLAKPAPGYQATAVLIQMMEEALGNLQKDITAFAKGGRKGTAA